MGTDDHLCPRRPAPRGGGHGRLAEGVCAHHLCDRFQAISRRAEGFEPARRRLRARTGTGGHRRPSVPTAAGGNSDRGRQKRPLAAGTAKRPDYHRQGLWAAMGGQLKGTDGHRGASVPKTVAVGTGTEGCLVILSWQSNDPSILPGSPVPIGLGGSLTVGASGDPRV